MPIRFNRKLLNIAICSAVAGAMPITAMAQEDAVLEEVVVYGDIRDNLQSAQAIKREADTVVDVITASDIGALPDKSVTEALQRVPGVSVERFAASDDPNHFTDEGTGVLVRGLDKVRSEINGRTSFSANPYGGLNFEDISPELLGSVRVIKNQTADMVAGGIAGTVNLVTRKPFDSDDRLIAASVKASYGDFREEVTPSYSFLFSDRWETSIGEFGFLVNVSGSEYETRGDGIGVANFYSRGPADSGAEGGPATGYEDEVVYLPGQISIRTAENDRERQGLATSLQWQNTDGTVVATAEYISSDASLAYRERVIGPQGQGFQVGEQTGINLRVDDADYPATFDDQGLFTSGILTDANGINPYLLSSRFNETTNDVEDYSFNLLLQPTDNLTIELDAQRIEATQKVENYAINGAVNQAVSDVYMDLRQDAPTIEFLNQRFTDPAAPVAGTAPDVFIRTLMDQNVDNDAEGTSFSGDIEYTFDEGWIHGVKGGVYYSDKDLTMRDTEYSNWGVSTISWGGDRAASAPANAPDYWERVEFDDFYKGGHLAGQNNFWFPKMHWAENFTDFTRQACEDGVSSTAHGGNAATSPSQVSPDCFLAQPDLGNRIEGTPYAPHHVSSTNEKRTEAYARMDFGNENLSMPVRGNIGLRYVSYQLESAGYTVLPSEPNPELQEFYPEDILAFADGSAGQMESVEGTDYSTVLPSLNLALSVTDDVIVRFAASKALYFPTLNQTRNSRIVMLSGTEVLQDPNLPKQDNIAWADYNPVVSVSDIELSGVARNAFLEPEESINFDLTAEWYFSNVGSLTGSLFYKELDNLFRDRTFYQDVTNASGVTQSVPFSGPVNEGTGKIQGLELSYTQFFDFLPGAWSGLGLQANYTYIDQQDLADSSSTASPVPRFSADGTPLNDSRGTFRTFTDLPLPGYSDQNYNITGMYEYEDLSIRLAYNWRSEYLVTRRDSNEFAPIYAKDTGYLDGSIFYSITDDIEVGLEMSNILDTETETMAQLNQEGDKTEALNFTTDRRFGAVVRAKF